MATIVQPVICVQLDIAHYIGASPADLAALLPSGAWTLGNVIDEMLIRSAWLIVQWCNFDYTPSQNYTEVFRGNNEYYIQLPHPVKTKVAFGKYVYGSNVLSTTTTLSVASLTIPPSLNTQLWITPGNSDNLTTFDSNYIWLISYTTDSISLATPPQYGTVTTGSWPEFIKQFQCEIIAIWLRDSGIGWPGSATTSAARGSENTLGYQGDFPTDNTRGSVKFEDMISHWQRLLRPYRKMVI